MHAYFVKNQIAASKLSLSETGQNCHIVVFKMNTIISFFLVSCSALHFRPILWKSLLFTILLLLSSTLFVWVYCSNAEYDDDGNLVKDGNCPVGGYFRRGYWGTGEKSKLEAQRLAWPLMSNSMSSRRAKAASVVSCLVLLYKIS